MVFQKCASKSDAALTVPKVTDELLGLVQESPNNAAEGICASIIEQQSSPRYFNTKQAAFYLNLSHQYLEIARHKGGGPQYIKLAKAVRYRLEDLDDWMDNHIQKHTADTNLRDASPVPTGASLDDAVEQGSPPAIGVERKKRGGENG